MPVIQYANASAKKNAQAKTGTIATIFSDSGAKNFIAPISVRQIAIKSNRYVVITVTILLPQKIRTPPPGTAPGSHL